MQKSSATALERIHHINHAFNRIFSVPLLMVAFLCTVLCFILPYHGRLLLSWVINLCCNRPSVYLHFWSKYIGATVAMGLFCACYWLILWPYAFMLNWWKGKAPVVRTDWESFQHMS